LRRTQRSNLRTSAMSSCPLLSVMIGVSASTCNPTLVSTMRRIRLISRLPSRQLCIVREVSDGDLSSHFRLWCSMVLGHASKCMLATLSRHRPLFIHICKERCDVMWTRSSPLYRSPPIIGNAFPSASASLCVMNGKTTSVQMSTGRSL
jgi:hypothetical protein